MLFARLPEDVGALHLDDTEAWAGSRTLTVEATAVGNDGQTLSGRGTLIVHAGDFYVDVKLGSKFQRRKVTSHDEQAEFLARVRRALALSR